MYFIISALLKDYSKGVCRKIFRSGGGQRIKQDRNSSAKPLLYQ